MNKNGQNASPEAVDSNDKAKECDSIKTSEVVRNEDKFNNLNPTQENQIDSSTKKSTKKVQERCPMPTRPKKLADKKPYVRKQVNT